MSVFDDLRNGQSYDIRNEDYQREVHGEIDRCDHICWEISQTDPADKDKLVALENELMGGQMKDGTFFTPPMNIDCASNVHVGKNVYANHHLTMMSLGTITIEDGVMMGLVLACLRSTTNRKIFGWSRPARSHLRKMLG
nr:sugar O-acetyltransferase [Secundilactobacillus collinoides]